MVEKRNWLSFMMGLDENEKVKVGIYFVAISLFFFRDIQSCTKMGKPSLLGRGFGKGGTKMETNS